MADTPSAWIDKQNVAEFEEARWLLANAENPLLALRGFALLSPAIADMELAAVRDARAMGVSWEKIADAMRRQKQAVWKQYVPLLNESATAS